MPVVPAVTVAAVAKFIGAGLTSAGWGVVTEAAIKPALRPGIDGVKGFLERLPRQRKASKALREAVGEAFEEIGAPQADGEEFSGYALRLGFDQLQGTSKANQELREMVAKTALLMRSGDPAEVPQRVYEDLRWPSDQRAVLAKFLYTLRQSLVDDEQWGQLVTYSEQEAARDYLSLAAGSLERIEALLAALTTYYGIASAEQDSEALEDFLELVRNKHRQLSFVFIKPAGSRRDLVTEAELEAVFVPLEVADPAREVETAAAGEESFTLASASQRPVDAAREGAARPLSINEVLAEYPVFLLRGEPGSGKTTLLRHMALSFARGEARQRLDWRGEPLLPILVPLRNFGRYLQNHGYDNNAPGPLRAFIESYFRDNELLFPPHFFRERLKQGRCLVMLDGLDEVADRDLRADVAQLVSAFIKHYLPKGNHFVIASRPKGYDEVAHFLPRPVVCNVQKLSPEGRDSLVGNLMRQFGGSRAKQETAVEELVRDIRGKGRVDELSRNPLFCTTLVLVYKYGGARLPERRVDVYQEVVNLMLGFWETQRADREDTVDVDDLVLMDGTGRTFMDEYDAIEAKGEALMHVAEWMQREVRKTDVSGEAVETELAAYFSEEEGAPDDKKVAWARGFLNVAHQRSGLYVEQDPETYAFAHKSFLEYLAATALVVAPDAEMLETIKAFARDEWWYEVILLAAAHRRLGSPRRKLFFQTLLDNGHIVLAGECAVDAGDRLARPVREQVLALLQAQMINSELTPQERYAAAQPWDSLGGLPADLNERIRCAACGDGKEDLLVGKYPVTNAQYELFLEDGGYDDSTYWGGEESTGWRWRQAGERIFPDMGTDQPEYWRSTRFGRERRGYPVVGVSLFEAQAYCRWLSNLLERISAGDESVTEMQRALVAALAEAGTRQVRLLTESEWIRAAGGENDDRFPWDRQGEATGLEDTERITARANVEESGIGGTTPVAMFADGASHPYGLRDLAGNIWEWMENHYDADEGNYALRGGSWRSVQGLARVAFRLWFDPNGSNVSIGFRAVSPVVLPADS